MVCPPPPPPPRPPLVSSRTCWRSLSPLTHVFGGRRLFFFDVPFVGQQRTRREKQKGMDGRRVTSKPPPHVRGVFISSTAIISEHSVDGLIVPGLYLPTRDELYYVMALNGEAAYMIYASVSILASHALGRDVTVEQMHEAVWPLLLVHHLATIALCSACILIGERVPKDLVCAALLAMLGLTSSLHYVGQILDFSPFAQAAAPYSRL